MTPIVETGCGKVRGTSEGGLEVFRGIPYAAPPLGERRLRPPAAPEPWGGARDATEFGPAAIQPEGDLIARDPLPQSEDCLTLNVWTPRADAARRPVLFWIHGGGFTTGSSAQSLYDGAALARRGDLVVVSINYRLGLLGLLTHPSLEDPETGVTGNWGLLDQIAALEWVRDNVERFGGDPNAVTIFGESAGGASVGALVIAPGARGLFRRGVIQSASPQPAAPETGHGAAEAVFEALGCDAGDLAALRRAEIPALLEVQPRWRDLASRGRTAPRPVIDGKVLPDWPEAAIDAGRSARLDLMIGSNRDETKLFALRDPARGRLTEERMSRRVGSLVPQAGISLVDALIATYRRAREARGEPTDPWELWNAISTDGRIRVPALDFAARHAGSGAAAFAYLVTWESPAQGGSLGACHGVELPFLFGTLDSAPGMRRFGGEGPQADAFGERVMDAWLAFARDGSPETEALGPWPRYDAARRATMILGRSGGVEDAPYEPERSAWRALG